MTQYSDLFDAMTTFTQEMLKLDGVGIDLFENVLVEWTSQYLIRRYSTTGAATLMLQAVQCVLQNGPGLELTGQSKPN